MSARRAPAPIRRWFGVAATVLVVTAWARGALHWPLRDEVRRSVAESTIVADVNRAFVADSQDWLSVGWLALPIVVGCLTTVTLLRGTGALLLIVASCVLGSTLLASGLLFPSAAVLHLLTVLPIAAMLAVVALALARPDALLDRDPGGRAARSA